MARPTPASALPLRPSGFTLVELLAVLVVLAVLAVVAVPQYADLRSGAINASLHAQAASLRAGVDAARLAWRMKSNADGPVVDLAGWGPGTADFDLRGWLTGTSNDGAALTDAHCAEIWNTAVTGALAVPWTGANQPGSRMAAQESLGRCLYYPLAVDGRRITTGSGAIRVIYDLPNVSGRGHGAVSTLDMDWDVRYWAPPP